MYMYMFIFLLIVDDSGQDCHDVVGDSGPFPSGNRVEREGGGGGGRKEDDDFARRERKEDDDFAKV